MTNKPDSRYFSPQSMAKIDVSETKWIESITTAPISFWGIFINLFHKNKQAIPQRAQNIYLVCPNFNPPRIRLNNGIFYFSPASISTHTIKKRNGSLISY